MQDLRLRHLQQTLAKWAPLSIGGDLSIAAAALPNPTFAALIASTTFAMQLLQKAREVPFRGTYIVDTQAMLIQLNGDLNWRPSWLKRVFSR